MAGVPIITQEKARFDAGCRGFFHETAHYRDGVQFHNAALRGIGDFVRGPGSQGTLTAGGSIDQILVNLHAHAGVVRDFLSEQNLGVEVTLSEEPVLLGSAGTIAANRQWVESEPFSWIFYADVLTNMDLARMLADTRLLLLLALSPISLHS